MTGNKINPEYIYLHQREHNVFKLEIISVFESCNQETRGNVYYAFHKQKNISAVYSRIKSSHKTEDRLFLIESNLSILRRIVKDKWR